MQILKKPEWIKKKLFNHSKENHIKNIINQNNVNTVCQEARCPNIGECFSHHTATFLLLGKTCTRNCKFCNISLNNDKIILDKNEPRRILDSVKKMKLKYVVLTSVTRDDLKDGGASIFTETVNLIKKYDNNIKIEVLVPDFKGNYNSIKKILNSQISVFNHNLETVKNLYQVIRPMADYNLSLEILKFAKKYNNNLTVKTGIMLGLGEKKEEVEALIVDVYNANADVLTIGQYLQPGKDFYKVKEYISLEIFDYYKNFGEKTGIKQVISAPFVRSSYLSEKIYLNSNLKI